MKGARRPKKEWKERERQSEGVRKKINLKEGNNLLFYQP
jgi:hypothetical protein